MKVEALFMPDGFCVPMHDVYFSHPERLAQHRSAAAEVLTAACAHIPERRVAVDVGAHIGTWTVQLADLFEQVVAFEPMPENFLLLMKNAGGLDNVLAFQAAIVGWPCRAELHLECYQDYRHHTACPFVKQGNGATKLPWAPGIRLDDLDLPRVDLLKLDIEGLEIKAMQGAMKTIGRCHPVVIFEDGALADRYVGHRQGEVKELLELLGYREVARVAFIPDRGNQTDVVMVWHPEAAT